VALTLAHISRALLLIIQAPTPFVMQVKVALLAVGLAVAAPTAPAEAEKPLGYGNEHNGTKALNIQVGPRPYYLVSNMDDGPLKEKLESCSEGPFYTSSFSISHRGAPLMFPEHSKEGYEAAVRMGAGESAGLSRQRLHLTLTARNRRV
jgi:glycerophosphoryl diester phosphodiesterase